MTKFEFFKKFHGTICPAYRGDEYPPFDKFGINEKNFSDALRLKDVNFDFRSSKTYDEVYVLWKSQSWDDDGINGFLDEIKRCFTEIGFTGRIRVKLYDRDGWNEETYTFFIGNDGLSEQN